MHQQQVQRAAATALQVQRGVSIACAKPVTSGGGGRQGSSGAGAGAQLLCHKCEGPLPGPAPAPAPPEGSNRDGSSCPSSSGMPSSWQCQGGCRRTFHRSCLAPASLAPAVHQDPSQSPPAGALLQGPAHGTCQQCSSGSHSCFACGCSQEPSGSTAQAVQSPVVRCSMGLCGRSYHLSCALVQQRTKPLPGGGAGFRCPLHYCATCGLSGDGVLMVQCMRCPVAYHARCKPAGTRQLSKRYILCGRHGS